MGEGRGIRRTVLHAALVERAESCGVELQWGRGVGELSGIRSRWIVGADGIQSRVRTLAGLGEAERDSPRFGFQCHYRVEPWSDAVEVYWGERCQAYVTPVGPDSVGIAVLTRRRDVRFGDALDAFPALRAQLGDARGSVVRGAAIASRRPPAESAPSLLTASA